ncbi:uncharacterized protein LOC131957912 [Physella acuta]|uniref:uncharacterized protein LOC131957912 n=1 Tax=Physella acuta TaxID=109671 RepID=UPI0027DE681A|nr:uncharacterized protein LOC131957912 [Physella acuta]
MARVNWIRTSTFYGLVAAFLLAAILLYNLSPVRVEVDRRQVHTKGYNSRLDNSQVNVPEIMDDYGTGPLENFRHVAHAFNLADLDVDRMTAEELLLTIHTYPDNIDVVCRRKLRMGKIGDGGWEVCDDPDVRPTMPCVVYSYGIHYDFSFDDDVAKLYGCHVYSFDPSMDKVEDRYNRSENVHFYKIGLDGVTHVTPKNWSLYTHGDIRKMLGHQNTPIDIIKMDIETFEWTSVPEMLASGQLQNVRQFLVEFHVGAATREYLLPRVRLMQDLERAGLRRFYVHKNFYCLKRIEGYPIMRTRCYEVHYMRR